jgi:hypothetical protein
MASFTLKGLDAMNRKIRRIADRFPDTVAGALNIEAELVMTRSKREFVPVDKGTLPNSGFVEAAVRVGNEVSVTMGFGGAAAAYATAVHETPSASDPPSWVGNVVQFSPAGHGRKYLERPLMEAVPGMPARIAARLEPKGVE